MRYAVVAATITTDIVRYVDAAYTLEETMGPQVLTPLMFALGRKVEVRNMHVLESPVGGIIKAREYLESGELRVEDITHILERKGYKQMAFS